MINTLTGFLDRIGKFLFVFGVAVFSFAAGFLVYHYKLPPYHFLFEAQGAAKEVSSINITSLTIDQSFQFKPVKHLVTIWNKEQTSSGVTLIGGIIQGKWQARLINNAGNTLHQWDIDFKTIREGADHFIKRFSPPIFHGIHLYPNGDLLVNLSYGAVPYGNGIIKVDKNSNPIWTIKKNTHHDISIAESGRIYTIEHDLRTVNAFPCKGVKLDNSVPSYYEDFASIYTPNGKLIERISVLKALCNSPYIAAFYPPGTDAYQLAKLDGETINTISSSEYVEGYDPLHVNAVRPISMPQAQTLPMANEGDILVSMRNLNAIGIIDKHDKTMKWKMAALFQRQHDPDILENGNIGIFDNRGNPEQNNLSQILVINPITQKIEWKYKGPPNNPFFTLKSGSKNHLKNGNTLIVESERARIFEVNPSGEIVWEYFNVHKANGRLIYGRIQDAHKYGCRYIQFIEGPCQ